MITETEKAASYRARAEKLRTIAAMDSNVDNRKILEAVAQDYETMAKALEAIDSTNKTIGRVWK